MCDAGSGRKSCKKTCTEERCPQGQPLSSARHFPSAAAFLWQSVPEKRHENPEGLREQELEEHFLSCHGSQWNCRGRDFACDHGGTSPNPSQLQRTQGAKCEEQGSQLDTLLSQSAAAASRQRQPTTGSEQKVKCHARQRSSTTTEVHLHKSVRRDWTTGPRAQRQAASRQHGACRWAAEGIFLLPRDTKGFATCPLRLIFSYCCVLGICTQIQLCTIRDVLALFSNKRTPDALENTETAEEKAIGIQSQPPLGLRRTTQCLEHLKLL